MDICDLHFAERSSFNREDLLEELWLSVEEVAIVLLPQNLELFKHVLNVNSGDSCAMCDLLDGKLLVLILEQQVQNPIGPVADEGAMAEEGEWFLRAADFVLDQ